MPASIFSCKAAIFELRKKIVVRLFTNIMSSCSYLRCITTLCRPVYYHVHLVSSLNNLIMMTLDLNPHRLNCKNVILLPQHKAPFPSWKKRGSHKIRDETNTFQFSQKDLLNFLHIPKCSWEFKRVLWTAI